MIVLLEAYDATFYLDVEPRGGWRSGSGVIPGGKADLP